MARKKMNKTLFFRTVLPLRRRAGFFLLPALLFFSAFPRSFAADTASLYPPQARHLVRKIGEEFGLGTASPNSILQDSAGFIWIGTDNGVYRYDGTRVIGIGFDQGLPRDQILQILQSVDGRIWVVTSDSLFYQSAGKFLKLALPAQVNDFASQQPLAADSRARLFAATDAGLLLISPGDPPSVVLLPLARNARPGAVQAVSAGRDHKIWFAQNGQVGWLDENLNVQFLPRQSLFAGARITAVVEDAQGRLWVRTPQRLFRLNRGARQFVMDPPFLPPPHRQGAPTINREGQLMVPTINGIFLHREDRWEVVTKRTGLPSNSIASIIEDREGSLWMGSPGNGLMQWQSNRMWSGWTDMEGLPDNVVWSVLRDRRKRLWIGTNAGVALWNPATRSFRIWREKDGLNGSSAQQILEGPDGSIWVLARLGGLTRFDPATLRPEKIAVPGPEVRFLGVSLDGHLWLTGRNSVRALRSWKAPFRLSPVKIPEAILPAADRFSVAQGVLWMGGKGGLARFDGKTWTLYDEKDGLHGGGILELLAVSPAEVWVCYRSDNGVTQFRLQNGTPQLKHFNESNGLPFDGVFMLGRDSRGSIWAGGTQGLARIASDGGIRHFSHSEGLIWDDIAEGAFFLDQDGSLLIGTSGGLARIDPLSDTNMPSGDPRVRFTSVRLGGHERLGETRVRAAHRENSLQAQFALLSYRNAPDSACWYRLQGAENETRKALHKEVLYAALPPGSYELEVSCQSGEGLRSDPVRFPFEIMPAWWQRWWARLFYLLLAAAAFHGLLRFRTYRLEEDRRQLEIAVEDRSMELAQAIKELEEASITDALTGAHNRRFFQKSIEAGVRQTLRLYAENRRDGSEFNRDLIFYLIDADNFKSINDKYGHDAGDELLVEITRRIKSAIRQSDDLIRWGGEEFLVVSRYTNRAEAATLAGRVLTAIGAKPFAVKAAKDPVWITCSVGWSAFPWFASQPEAVKYQAVLELADRALYQAKDAGRNCSIGLLPPQIQDAAVPAEISPDSLPTEVVRLAGPRRPVNPATVL
jgi:diguanylate cyclase (GGDEF)-like protein